MPVAAVIGVAAAASVAGGVMQANAQKDASRQNRKAVEDTNQLNYEMFRESRGEGGNAMLPLYAEPGTEKAMIDDALALYNSLTTASPQDKLKEYQGAIDVMRPAVAGGNQVISDIYSGAMEQQRLQDLAPVLQARAAMAQADADAINLALQQEQNRINADEARKGFVGGGSFANNRLLQSSIQAQQGAAQARGAANLANTQDTRAVNESQRDIQLRSLDVPLARANQIIALNQAPSRAVLADQQAAQAAMDWFKLNPGNPPNAQAPQVSAVPSTGAVIASGIAQGAGSYANYLAAKNFANSMNGNTLVNMGGSVPSNYGQLTPTQQQLYNQQYFQAHQAAGDPNLYT